MDKEETKINSRVVSNIVRKILEYVNRLDPKFKKYPQKFRMPMNLTSAFYMIPE